MVDKAKKIQAVDDMKNMFSESSTVVVFQHSGLTVDESGALRNKARESGARIRVTKNTLAKIAANDTDCAGLIDHFVGQTAVAASEDAVAAAKVVSDFAKENEKISIIAGVIDGKVLDASGVAQLANTPGLDESRAKIVGLLTAGAGKLASVLQAPAGQVARVCGAYGSTS